MKYMIITLHLVASLMMSPLMAASLQTRLDEIINHVDPQMPIGMQVVDLNTNTTLYQRHVDDLFVPASNMKLFSEAATLLLFGPDYRFKTQLSTSAHQLDHGVLKGSVDLELPGDPSLRSRDIRRLLVALRRQGMTNIQGNIILHTPLYAIRQDAPGVVLKDFNYSYGAPVGPLILDENQVTIITNPGPSVGKPAIITHRAPEQSVQIINHVTTSEKNSGLSFKMNEENQLTLQGSIGRHQTAIVQHVAIRNPKRYAAALIMQQLSHLGIQLQGQIILSEHPVSQGLILSRHYSKPLSQLMADTLKASNNVYADGLYLHTATRLQNAGVRWEQAEPLVKRFLQWTTGITFQNGTWIDGSGLSRHDRVTPLQTVALLRYIYTHFPLSYEYIAALPIGGQDGTLQRRFGRHHHRGFIRAKTGTMTGVLSLSGYLYTPNGHTLAFAMYINTRPGTKPSISGRYRSVMDQLCETLLAFTPENSSFHDVKLTHLHPTFHQKLSFIQHALRQQGRWRQLEGALKKALQSQAVTVLYQNQQLILIDHQADVNHVWRVLEALHKKYSFSVILQAPKTPQHSATQPALLWISTNANTTQQVWTILRED